MDPDVEISLETVKKRSLMGVITLSSRTFILQAVSLVAIGIFGVLLEHAQYGTYALVLSARAFLAYFSDIGLAGALIQKRGTVSEKDLRTTFLIQQLLVLALVSILFLLTPFLKNLYDLQQDGVWLIWAFGASLIFSSLKTIPSVLLERKLDFTKLVIPQIVETILFNVIAIYLALNGWGLTSFTVAVLAQGIVGLVLLYILQPWRPGIAFSIESLKGLLKFGIPYQTNTFLAMIKDEGLSLSLAAILGLSGFGLFDWARKWGHAPLRFFMDQVIKVTFPGYARLQDNKKELENAVSKSLFFISFLTFPALVGLVILSPILTEIIPKYEKWQPALLALGIFTINAAWAAISTPLTNLFNAVGKISWTFRLMVMWTIISWVVIPPAAYFYGVNGAAIGYAVVGSTSIITILLGQRLVKINYVNNVLKPLVASIGMGLILFIVKGLMVPSIQWVFILTVFGASTYILSMIFLVGPSLIQDMRKVKDTIAKKD